MQSVLTIISAVLLSVLMPACLIEPPEPVRKEPIRMIIEQPVQKRQTESGVRTVRLLEKDTVVELPLEEYLIGVVLAEMPASFELEALKAQAVAARTFTLRHMEKSKHQNADLCADSACCQAWSSRTELEGKLGSSWTNYWEKAKTAVRETADQVLTYDGMLIDAVYFSCSGGATEDAVAVWGSDVPYLQSVPSEGEEDSRKYKSQVRVPGEKFRSILEGENHNVSLKGKPASWIGAVTRTEGGGVLEWEIGGQSFRGTELRRLFQLNSAKFDLSAEKQELVFDVYGAGHRVGMSQYGANAMAEDGKDYREILNHYYTDTELEVYENAP